MFRINFLILTILLSFSLVSYSQEDTTSTELVKMIVIKNDGAQYIGFILSDDGREIFMETEEVGKLYIPKHMIKSISVFDPSEVKKVEPADDPSEISYKKWKEKFREQEEYEFQNYTSTKYIQTDNALPLRKGEAFAKFMPVGFEVQLPITKNWSAGVISSYIGAPFGVKTKFSWPIVDSLFHVGFDINYGTMMFGGYMDVDERNGGGYASATLTYGDRLKNFSVKAGYAMIHQYWEEWIWDDITGNVQFIDGEMAYNNFAFVNFGGHLQINERTAFVLDMVVAYGEVQSWGENFNTFLATASAAARFGPNPRHRFQLGGSLFMYDGFFIPVPIPNISYTHVFHKRNP